MIHVTDHLFLKSGITRRIHFNDAKEILATESDCHNLNEYHFKFIQTSCLLFSANKSRKASSWIKHHACWCYGCPCVLVLNNDITAACEHVHGSKQQRKELGLGKVTERR